ncbi:MAG: prolyl oligopeptidase family serine peptidase [Armatimonadetes bacterium]|nr:prolyl oligopeptidase family serine peptidase [Armatimonadota bacterium]
MTGFLNQTITVDGKTIKYVLYVPADYEPARPWPLILFLHGAGERGADGLRPLGVGVGTAVMAAPARWPFLILFPQCPEGVNWNTQEDALLAMLKQTQHDYRVDKDRVYLTGISMGGYGTWNLGARHPELFAALAPVCGGGDPATAAGLKGKPIRAFHGDQDGAVPPERGQAMIEAARATGADATMTMYPGVGHNSWDKAYREENLAEWFLAHTQAR